MSKSTLLRDLHSGQLSVMTIVAVPPSGKHTPGRLAALHVMLQQALSSTLQLYVVHVTHMIHLAPRC